jgi:hypothetical protein
VTEKLFVASAASYVISPAAIGRPAVDPERSTDRLSASYLIALGARIVREVGELWNRARAEKKRLATLSLDAGLRFCIHGGYASDHEGFQATSHRCRSGSWK